MILDDDFFNEKKIFSCNEFILSSFQEEKSHHEVIEIPKKKKKELSKINYSIPALS